MGDVVGKGAEAAAMMGLARYTIRTAAMSEGRPSAILETLNQAILKQTNDQRFCTACAVRLRPSGDMTRATVCSGGHPLPLVLRADGSTEVVGTPARSSGCSTTRYWSTAPSISTSATRSSCTRTV